MESVAAFTDTYLPTVNGVTYTVQSWRDRWQARGGRMEVVYPDAPEYEPEPDEHPVRSLPLPIYAGYRLGAPRVPDTVTDVDVVHAHTPFAIGLAGLRLAQKRELPLVASFHTPTSEYAAYLSSWGPVKKPTAALSRRYESWFLNKADAVVVPSESTGEYVATELGVDSPEVVPNGVDTERFRPVDPTAFRERHDLPTDRTLVGYTGRHGHEKSLPAIIAACDRLDREVTVVFGGDGPARAELEEAARKLNVDARFLGFLDREELPAFYAGLDAFLFPSPVETQGLVALEAFACGTPVVGVDSGALSDTVDEGVTGYHFEPDDVDGFADAIARTLDERERLRENCLDRRASISVEHAVDRLTEIYAAVRE
ncbi:glycosyltransferase [Halolamina sp. CBA1230]|uniref:glycosyltransferase n=1 Tax=Halolamina sp. CBA1230 TaxID=1853690 RepID=UPI0009A14AB2|nr:glycosyltransferase [Halolamina sp. CBA1230]QKY19550.1 glycosyltransferase [Halolamina sp. CBA1230]